MTPPQTPRKDLAAVITRLEAHYPGDVDTIMEKLLGVLAYCITHKLLDSDTVAALRAQALQWPESIRKLLAGEGAL